MAALLWHKLKSNLNRRFTPRKAGIGHKSAMSRIATLPPIADDSANKRAAAAVDVVQPVTVRSARILSLVLVLEALRDLPAVRDQ